VPAVKPVAPEYRETRKGRQFGCLDCGPKFDKDGAFRAHLDEHTNMGEVLNFARNARIKSLGLAALNSLRSGSVDDLK